MCASEKNRLLNIRAACAVHFFRGLTDSIWSVGFIKYSACSVKYGEKVLVVGALKCGRRVRTGTGNT